MGGTLITSLHDLEIPSRSLGLSQVAEVPAWKRYLGRDVNWLEQDLDDDILCFLRMI